MEPHIGAKFQKIPALGYRDTQDRPEERTDGRTNGRTGLNFKVQSLLRRGTKNAWETKQNILGEILIYCPLSLKKKIICCGTCPQQKYINI